MDTANNLSKVVHPRSYAAKCQCKEKSQTSSNDSNDYYKVILVCPRL